jgi:hypothetical protein
MKARRGRGNVQRQVSKDLCLAPSNLGDSAESGPSKKYRAPVIPSNPNSEEVKGARNLGRRVLTPRRPVGTGSLPLSGEERRARDTQIPFACFSFLRSVLLLRVEPHRTY